MGGEIDADRGAGGCTNLAEHLARLSTGELVDGIANTWRGRDSDGIIEQLLRPPERRAVGGAITANMGGSIRVTGDSPNVVNATASMPASATAKVRSVRSIGLPWASSAPNPPHPAGSFKTNVSATVTVKVV